MLADVSSSMPVTDLKWLYCITSKVSLLIMITCFYLNLQVHVVIITWNSKCNNFIIPNNF